MSIGDNTRSDLPEEEPLRLNEWSEPLAWLVAVAATGLGVFDILSGPSAHADGQWWVNHVYLVLLGPFIGRSAMAGIWVQPDGIRLRTMLHTYDLSWPEVESFRIRKAVFRSALLVKLVDGREIPAFGFVARSNRERERAKVFVRALEERIAR